jgi:predicted MFS family arabinose efflux permease
MALVGASIGLTFALSLVAAPLLYEWVGMAGLFHLTGAMAVLGIASVLFAVPPLHVPAHVVAADGTRLERTRFREVALDGELLRLNVGIFALHMVQMAMFVVLPAWLVERAQLPLADHWKIYLPVVAASFVLMVPPITWGERAGRLRAVVLASIALILAAQLGYAAQPVGVWTFAVLLLVFFAAFNVLEATVPSMVSRLAPPDVKGTALGLYNTVQALGLFAGGAIGGWASSRFGGVAVFVLCAGVMAVWFVVAMGARRWPQPGGRRAAAGAG